jgi:dienelactone hydrolase
MNRRALLTLGVSMAAVAKTGGAAAQTAASPPPAARSGALLFHADPEFWFETVRLFGAAEYGGALFGEVLAIAQAIKAGDYDSWYDANNAAADRVAAEAEVQRAKGHRVSARDSLLRASNYYRSSEFFLHARPDDPRVSRAYTRSVECYKAAAALFAPAIAPVEIPYEGTTLPGYFHTPDSSGRRRPTILLHTGFDGSAEEMHWAGARAAVERGYNVLVFDGPGQFGPLHRQRLTFRPDWEKVVGPVVDFALERNDVDPRRIALYGVSFGGYLAPRAAAFETRLAACIADDGVYDYGAAQLAGVPEALRAEFLRRVMAQSDPQLDARLEQTMQANGVARWSFAHGMYAMGVSSPRAYIAAAQQYHLRDGIAEKVRCPTLVGDAEADLFFKGQAQQLFDHLTCPKTLLKFTAAEGAGAHCEVGASRLAYARIYDWLDETLA